MIGYVVGHIGKMPRLLGLVRLPDERNAMLRIERSKISEFNAMGYSGVFVTTNKMELTVLNV